LERELINITKDKEHKLSQMKIEYDQKQRTLEQDFNSKLEETKRIQNQLQQALTKLSEQLKEKAPVNGLSVSQAPNLTTFSQKK